MGHVSHFMRDGNFLCGFMGGGMVFEAENEEDVTCPECKKILESENKVDLRKKFGIYEDE